MNSAGSANKENAKALDSIQGKTQAFKSALEELVNQTISSDAIKGIVDFGTNILKLGSNMDSLLPVITTLLALPISNTIGTIITSLQTLYTTIAAGEATVMSFSSVIGLVITAISAVVSGIEIYQAKERQMAKEAATAADSTLDQVTAIGQLEQQYEDIIDSSATEAEKNSQLASIKKTLVEQYGFEEDAIKGVTSARKEDIAAIEEESLKKINIAIAENSKEYEKSKKVVEEYQQSLVGEVATTDPVIQELSKYGIAMQDASDNSKLLTIESTNLIDQYDNLTSALAYLQGQKDKGLLTTDGELIAYSNIQNAVNNMKQDYEAYATEYESGTKLIAQSMILQKSAAVDSQESFNNYRESLLRSTEGNKELQDAIADQLNNYFPQYIDSINTASNDTVALGDDSEGASVQLSGLSDTSASLSAKLYTLSTSAGYSEQSIFNLLASMSSFNGASLDVSQKLAALAQLTIAAGNASSAINSVLGTYQARSGAVIAGYVAQGMTKAQAEAKYYSSAYAEFTGDDDYSKHEQKAATTPKGSGGGGGGGSSSKTDTQLENLKSIVSLRKSELDLMQERGDSEESQIGKMKEIQTALANEAAYLRKVGGSQEDINELSTEWWKIQKQIVQAQKQIIQNTQDQIDKKIDLLNKEKDEINDYYDAEIDKLQEANDELENNLELQEAIEALDKAKSLRKHVYKDGSFQYVEDVDAVAAAQKNLDEVQRKQNLESQVKALEDARDSKIKSIDDEIQKWEDYKDYLDDLSDSLDKKNTTMLNMEQSTTDQESQIFNQRLSNVSSFVSQYNSLMSGLGSTSGSGAGFSAIGSSSGTGIDATSAFGTSDSATTGTSRTRTPRSEPLDRLSNISSIKRWYYGKGNDDKYKAYLKATDFSTLASKATTLEQLQDYLEMREVKAKELGFELGKNGIASTQDLWDKYSGNVKTSWRDTYTGKDYTGTLKDYNEWYKLRFGTESEKAQSVQNDLTGAKNFLYPSGTPGYNVQQTIAAERYKNANIGTDLSGKTEEELAALYMQSQGLTSAGGTLEDAEKLKSMGYASGTTNASKGIHKVGENGAELRLLNNGDGIIPAKATSNLMQLGQYSPTQWFSQLKGEATGTGYGNSTSLSVANVTLPNVSNAQEFVAGLKNLAVQYSTQRK